MRRYFEVCDWEGLKKAWIKICGGMGGVWCAGQGL